MLGADRFVGAAIREAELPAADVATGQGDRAQCLAACALPRLALQNQQLAVRHFGGAVVLPGQPGDKVEIRLAELVGPGDQSGHRAHRLPAVAGGHVCHDTDQCDDLPTAAAGGFAAAAHIAGLAPDHQGIRWAGQFDLVHGVTPEAG